MEMLQISLQELRFFPCQYQERAPPPKKRGEGEAPGLQTPKIEIKKNVFLETTCDFNFQPKSATETG
jgi:hypothetical protein